MIDCKHCFLAGVCFLYLTTTLAQTEKSNELSAKDTSIFFAGIQRDSSEELINTGFPIIYQSKPTTLVFIDGEPVITVDEELYLYRIVNCSYLLLKSHLNNKYYLYTNGFWYVSDTSTFGYTHLKVYPDLIQMVNAKIKAVLKQTAAPQIVVCTEPTELIQTTGAPKYKNVPGTSLSYIENSPDNIFKDSIQQNFYVLLAGRWYRSSSLSGGSWSYIPSDQLPADFAKIPDASPKANVLVHVAGTVAAQLAVSEAEFPKVIMADRKKDTINVVYDGGAEFSSISNTGLFISENSNYPVINVNDKYYALKKGVWFISTEAMGPWQVSTERPADIDKVPITHRAYSMRHVYIFDSTADYVKTGYTSGYLNYYIENKTIVWGTGYSYKSWARRFYYPRPTTWGWNMVYDPKKGWKNKLSSSYYKDRK